MTAQHFMADIKRQLDSIDKQLCEVVDILVEEHESELLANYGYLRQVTSAVQSGRLGPEDVVVIGGQLDDIERQSGSTFQFALTRLKKKAAETISEESNWFGLNEYIEEAKKNASPVSRYGSLSLVALRQERRPDHRSWSTNLAGAHFHRRR